jgi:hypothetical protein
MEVETELIITLRQNEGPDYIMTLLNRLGHAIAWWLRHSATTRKVAGSRPDEVKEFFSIYLILPAALGPEVYSTSNRNEYEKHKNNNVSGEQNAAGS